MSIYVFVCDRYTPIHLFIQTATRKKGIEEKTYIRNKKKNQPTIDTQPIFLKFYHMKKKSKQKNRKFL